jgi:hypothetical protein
VEGNRLEYQNRLGDGHKPGSVAMQDSHLPNVTRALPGRSLSTFSFREGLQKGGAAPFPSIPTSREVQELKSQSELEMQRMHVDLLSLQHERNSFNHRTPSITSPDPSKGIREYRSLLISDSTIASVVAANRLRKVESADTSCVASPLFRRMITT